MADHRSRYKNSGLDSKELRRRREEDSVMLRRQKRFDVLSKRRTVTTDEPVSENLNDFEQEQYEDFTITTEAIQAILQNDNLELLLDYAQKIRKILSKEPQPPFDEVIKSGLIPRFVELLDRNDAPMIQFEVAWILTNICSGTSEQTKAVVDHGAVPKLMNLLTSTDMKVSEQAVWALGNIIGDGPELRDFVIAHNFIPALLSLIRPDQSIEFIRNETWVLVNLCRNKEPPPSLDIIRQLIPALNFLVRSTDLAVLIDTSWAISYICEQGSDYSQLVIDSGLVELVAPLLSHEDIKIQTAAIRALGSIVTGDEDQTQVVIDAGALVQLRKVLAGREERVIKEALWFLSNITAGSTGQIQAILDNQLLGPITHHLEVGNFLQQKEAVWIIYNYCLSGNTSQIQILGDSDVIPGLCKLLDCKDISVTRNVLETIQIILTSCNNPSLVASVESCGGLDKIEELQNSPNTDIYTFAYQIIDKFFNAEVQDS